MHHDLPRRKNIRLATYDYSQAGYYYLTVCTKDKAHLLWDAAPDPDPDHPPLSPVGQAVAEALERIGEIYEGVWLDKSVIMPNHFHMIVVIERDGQAKVPVSRIVQQCKGAATRRARIPLWQKGYYEHVIRDERDYRRIWQYIDENPIKWSEDVYYAPPVG